MYPTRLADITVFSLQQIPNHCNIKGNEAANKLAKVGSSMEQPENPVPQSA